MPDLYYANVRCQGCTPLPCGCICWDGSRTVRLLFHLGITWVARQRLWSQAKRLCSVCQPSSFLLSLGLLKMQRLFKTHYIFIFETFWFVSEEAAPRESFPTKGRRWPVSVWLKYSREETSAVLPLTYLCICLCSWFRCDAVHSSAFQPPESSVSLWGVSDVVRDVAVASFQRWRVRGPVTVKDCRVWCQQNQMSQTSLSHSWHSVSRKGVNGKIYNLFPKTYSLL